VPTKGIQNAKFKIQNSLRR